MAVSIKYQNLFESKEQAIVITVNCVGAMGKGVALQFKQRWPHLFNIYNKRCRGGKLSPGTITRNEVFQLPNGQYAILMPTKYHWRDDSEIEWVEKGLKDLKKISDQFCLETIGLPPPGCGNGHLDFEEVMAIIRREFPDTAGVDLTVYV